MQVPTNQEPKNLTEAQEYYIGLFERWQKMSMDENVKAENPELWEELQKVEFDEIGTPLLEWNFLDYFTSDVTRGRQRDGEIHMYLNLYFNFEVTDDKNFDNEGNLIHWSDPYIINEKLLRPDWFKKILELTILDKTLEKLKLLNLDFNGIVNFPEDLELLLELQKQNRLEIIDCVNYAELENQQLKNELEVIKKQETQLELVGKLVWSKEINLSEAIKPIQIVLLRHIGFFGEFIELTEGKKVQMRITSTENLLLLEIFSYNGATEFLIEKKYYEFVNNTLAEEGELPKFSFGEKIDPLQKEMAKYKIGYQKGIFESERKNTEEMQGITVGLVELSKTLASKLPDYNMSQTKINSLTYNNHSKNYSANNNKDSSLNIGENN
jgi:hypothetical protein